MLKRYAALEIAMGIAFCAVGIAQQANTVPHLSAAQIAEKNAVARGGLQRWRNVKTMAFQGEMEAGGNHRPSLPMPGVKDKRALPARPAEQVRLPFVMELKRPLKSRIEITFAGQNAVQVWDGTSGWKLRPFLNRHDVEPYSPEEMRKAAKQFELDGPLIDYAAKGSQLELEGTEKVGTADTYRLKLTRKNGTVTHVWVDSATFLEAKMDGTPRRLDGRERQVEILMRDYKEVDGLKIPFVLETKVVAAPPGPGIAALPSSELMVLNKVEVNPRLDDMLFTRTSLSAAPGAPAPAVQAKAGQ